MVNNFGTWAFWQISQSAYYFSSTKEEEEEEGGEHGELCTMLKRQPTEGIEDDRLQLRTFSSGWQ